MKMKPIIVSYYTKDKIYTEMAAGLTKSLERFDLEYEVVGIESFGAHQQHCFYKSEFLMQMYEKHDRPLIWSDADNEFVKYPAELFNVKTDLAVPRFYKWDLECSAHLLYFAHNEKILKLLKIWDWANKNLKVTAKTAEQHCFHQVLLVALMNDDITLTPLPKSYYEKCDDPVIIQHKASKKGRVLYAGSSVKT